MGSTVITTHIHCSHQCYYASSRHELAKLWHCNTITFFLTWCSYVGLLFFPLKIKPIYTISCVDNFFSWSYQLQSHISVTFYWYPPDDGILVISCISLYYYQHLILHMYQLTHKLISSPRQGGILGYLSNCSLINSCPVIYQAYAPW